MSEGDKDRPISIHVHVYLSCPRISQDKIKEVVRKRDKKIASWPADKFECERRQALLKILSSIFSKSSFFFFQMFRRIMPGNKAIYIRVKYGIVLQETKVATRQTQE